MVAGFMLVSKGGTESLWGWNGYNVYTWHNNRFILTQTLHFLVKDSLISVAFLSQPLDFSLFNHLPFLHCVSARLFIDSRWSRGDAACRSAASTAGHVELPWYGNE